MKRSEELRQQLENLKALKEQKYYEMVTSRMDSWRVCGTLYESKRTEMEL